MTLTMALMIFDDNDRDDEMTKTSPHLCYVFPL